MGVTATGYRHIVRDSEGRLRLERTGHKIIFLIGEHVESGLDARAIAEVHPELALGEIYEMLAYYYDHADAMNEELQVRRRFGERMQAAAGNDELTSQLVREYDAWWQSINRSTAITSTAIPDVR